MDTNVEMKAEPKMTEKDWKQSLAEIFEYQPPEEDQIANFRTIRKAAVDFAVAVVESCPSCADRTAAIRKIREAMMTANAAISLRGRGVEQILPR
jgi:hypothetical protein